MDLAFIQRLIELHERSTLAELEYLEGGERIRLTKTATPDSVDEQASTSGSSGDAPSASQGLPASPASPDKPQRISVKAGMGGTFHRKPAPDATPFVQVGDAVAEGQTLAIVEAMKMLNAVEAQCAGRIVEVLAEDGVAVSAGMPLFVMEPMANAQV